MSQALLNDLFEAVSGARLDSVERLRHVLAVLETGSLDTDLLKQAVKDLQRAQNAIVGMVTIHNVVVRMEADGKPSAKRTPKRKAATKKSARRRS